MEGLAFLAAVLLIIILLGGPIAIALTKIKTTHALTTCLRRCLHGFVVVITTWVAIIFAFNSSLPFIVHLIALYALAMGYIAVRREYFPDVRIITPLLLKGRGTGRSRGNDGHGPRGQS